MATNRIILPYHKDWTIYQGAKWSAYIICKDANEVAKNLDGYTANMQLRTRRGGEVLISLDETSGITITAVAGQIAWALTGAQTAALNVKTAEYDLFINNGGGTEPVCLIEGTITIKQRVTVEA